MAVFHKLFQVVDQKNRFFSWGPFKTRFNQKKIILLHVFGPKFFPRHKLEDFADHKFKTLVYDDMQK